jgi:porin
MPESYLTGFSFQKETVMSLKRYSIQSGIAAGFFLLGSQLPSLAADSNGSAIYKHHCATCHNDRSTTHAPDKSEMQMMFLDSIVESLESGSMAMQGNTLSPEEKRRVAEFLTPPIYVKQHFVLAGNPRAATGFFGNGMLGRELGFKERSGVTLGGVVQLDGDWLISGGLKPNSLSGNSVVGVNLQIDSAKVMRIPGGQFSVDFCKFRGMDNNAQAGSVQGYDNLPGASPYSRSELLQLWWLQNLFHERLILKLGKLNGAAEFNTVLVPVPVAEPKSSDWTISDLLYAPSGLNPTLSGRLPAFYDTAYGAIALLEPVRSLYAQYGIFDGNVARGVTTGLNLLPNINSYKFHIAEAGYAWRLGDQGKPGKFAAGGWHQTGKLLTPASTYKNGDSGFYAFATQRLWYQHPGANAAGLESYAQFGDTNSSAAPAATRYVGAGITVVNLLKSRPLDSFGAGLAWSRLNHSPASRFRSSEIMWQAYYKAVLIPWRLVAVGAYSAIPTPGEHPGIPAANALTARLIFLF